MEAKAKTKHTESPANLSKFLELPVIPNTVVKVEVGPHFVIYTTKTKIKGAVHAHLTQVHPNMSKVILRTSRGVDLPPLSTQRLQLPVSARLDLATTDLVDQKLRFFVRFEDDSVESANVVKQLNVMIISLIRVKENPIKGMEEMLNDGVSEADERGKRLEEFQQGSSWDCVVWWHFVLGKEWQFKSSTRDMKDMRACNDGLLSATAVSVNSAYGSVSRGLWIVREVDMRALNSRNGYASVGSGWRDSQDVLLWKRNNQPLVDFLVAQMTFYDGMFTKDWNVSIPKPDGDQVLFQFLSNRDDGQRQAYVEHWREQSILVDNNIRRLWFALIVVMVGLPDL
ncbi:hypothetical protein SASPL_103666 [Salvia splendens]|uniref:Uncharacterized protein n=1 Tax=Salvia splendens TaxID=180675 RepID=A0A8X8YM32_SALSN|nr:hypothetical protein SASPL_103666 [Salvia splendens]